MGLCVSYSNSRPKGLTKIPPILLVGTGGSGKSTFCKQMQVIHNVPIDISTYKSILLSNIIVGMQERVKVAEKLDAELQPDNRKHLRAVKEMNAWGADWNEHLVHALNELWQDEGITNANKTGVEFQLQVQEMEYLFSRLPEYIKPDCVLNDDDIVRARQRTTGANITQFNSEKYQWTLIDLGGQFSERNKWQEFLGEIDSVDNIKTKSPFAYIAFFALDEYDVKSNEDNTKTKMQLSVEVVSKFAGIEEAKALCPIIFLNKRDLLAKKLSDENSLSNFKKHFPDYTGGNTESEITQHVEKYVRKHFAEAGHEKVSIHVTNALDRQLIGDVFFSVQKFFMNRLMSSYGL